MSAPKLPAGLRLAAAADISEAGALVADVEQDGARLSILLTRRGETVHAFLNRCAHADYPLQRADGRVVVQEGRYLVCGAHGASYDLESGACAGGSCNGKGLLRITVALRDGEVFTA